MITGTLALDIHQIYQQTLNRSLHADEVAFLEQLIKQYPYFSLPRWLLLQQREDPKETFQAALRVGRRQQLKKFLHDRLYFAEISLRATMADQTDQMKRNIWFPPYAYASFSILNPKEFPHKFPAVQEPFSIPYPVSSRSFPFLENLVEECTQRYLPQVKNIRVNIRIPKETQEEPATPSRNVAADQLVDQFLSNLPNISPSRPKEEQASPEIVSKAKASVAESQEFVSETLARLHLRQGNKAEAVRMYRLLGLRFPEKSDYFAAQIEIIQQGATGS